MEGSYLGFDFGEARIGVAIGTLPIAIAHPLLTIHTRENAARFAKIEALIKEWQAVGLVVGFPTHDDGREHELSALCRKFAQRLSGRFRLPVYLVDERHSSRAAEILLKEAGVYGKKQKHSIDQVAAQTILECFLNAPDCAQSI